MSEQPFMDAGVPQLDDKFEDGRDDDLATLLARREHAKPNKVTWVLVTLLVLLVGFIGGAAASKKFADSSTSTPAGVPAGFPAGFTGAGSELAQGPGTAGQIAAGPAGGFGSVTVGTVKLVDGTNVYITTTSGETVKITVPADASVTTRKQIALADLAVGSTVMVRGGKGSDGTVTATSVSEGDLPSPQSLNTGATP